MRRNIPRHVAVDRVAETTVQDHSNQSTYFLNTMSLVCPYVGKFIFMTLIPNIMDSC